MSLEVPVIVAIPGVSDCSRNKTNVAGRRLCLEAAHHATRVLTLTSSFAGVL